MAATVGTNSYINLADANTYFSDKYGVDAWNNALDPVKESALVSATQILDLHCDWYGSKLSDSQALEFPRNYSDANPVPQDIIDAQCEIALKILEEESTSQDTGDAIEEIKAGSVELKFKATSAQNPLINTITQKLLSQYGLCSGTGSTKVVPVLRG